MKWIASVALTAAFLTIGTAPGRAADAWAGTYKAHSGSYRWQATITAKSAGAYTLHMSVHSRMPECSGDTTEMARLAGGKLVTASKECALTVARRGLKIIRVEEIDCNEAHGVACPFSSELTRR